MRLTNFAEWLRFLRSRLDAGVFVLACVVCWRIWWIRNRIVHGEMEGAGGDIVEGVDHFLEAYQAAQFACTLPGPNMNGT